MEKRPVRAAGYGGFHLLQWRQMQKLPAMHDARRPLSAPRTVLVMLHLGDYGSRMLAGVREFADAAGWRLQTVEYSRDEKSRYRLTRTPTGDTVADLLRFWKPAGCIVQCVHPPTALQPADFADVPAVFLDRTPDTLPGGGICVCSDGEAVARAASREQLQPGVENFAFVPWTGSDAWARARGEAFRRFVELNGKRLHVFRHPPGASPAAHLSEHLAPWVEALPKPCGVFAANDQIAEGVIAACAMRGVAVPDDIAVVGVDDNAGICENIRPTLSSVAMDFEGGGRIAAETLQDMMDADAGRAAHAGKAVAFQYGDAGVVRRESSRFLPARDAAVRRALEFIRLHACEGVGPRDVVRAMGLGRTQADLRFRAAVRHTLLDEIHAVRLARAKDLAARGVSPAAIADQCGYSSLADFQRVFRRRVGTTLRAWAKARR